MPRLFRIFLLLICSTLLHADPLSIDKVPDPLKPWLDWVLQDETDFQCPFFYNNFGQKHCAWPGRLKLEIGRKQGRFSSEWTVYQRQWIELPGNHEHWPQSVLVNDKAAVVTQRNGKPVIRLSSGHYRIEGRFAWDSIPDNLAIPDATGLLDLSIEGKKIDFPTLKKGAVWLKESDIGRKKPENIQNRLDLQVFRKVYDDVPLQLTTYLELEVSGEQREIKLAHAQLPYLIPVSLSSPIPARLEGDGSLLLQVRPGRWHIELKARHPEPLQKLTFDVKDETWPAAEIWVFHGLPYLRLVEIENLPALDPTQTNLPPAWRNLPAYRIKQGDSMVFKVIRRGDPEPEPNQLKLSRKLWLDFDGGGYTVEDQVSGKMTRGWRLNAQPSMHLGQVMLNGQNQLITRIDDQQQGIEVRKGQLQLKADSRLEGDIGSLSAVGWQQDFHQVNAELNIPPGWRLLAASGVDNDPDSWISRWTLLDLFLVLIAALAIARLWNIYWGLFALLSLTMIWHEHDAPRFVWLNILAAIALIRVLPAGRMMQWIKWYRNLCWFGLLVIAVPFMIDQVRIGLYPQLEKQWRTIAPVPTIMTDSAESLSAVMEGEPEVAAGKALSKRRSLQAPSALYQEEKRVDFDRIDPDAKVQTGPGLPQWQWHKVRLSWNGRVDQSQQLRLWYLSPSWMMMLNFLRVLMVLGLSCLMFGVVNKKLKLSMPVWSLLLLTPLLAVAPSKPAYADFPDSKILEELKNRLLQSPDCAPECAQIANMTLVIDEESMTLALQAHAGQDTAIPLPAHDEHWYPSQVSVDGDTAPALLRQGGQLWLNLAQGRHDIVMKGLLSANRQFTLPLPLKPHRIEYTSQGWSIDGVYENGRAGNQLQFTRLQTQKLMPDALQPTQLPPFVRIERTLRLGLDWRIDTRVVRVERTDVPVVLEYPLLPNELVTTANIRVKDGRVLVNMAAGQQWLQWQSVLEKSEVIALQAVETTLWNELWRADVSPIWHLETSGIAVVHHQDRRGRWSPEWRPWPGESIALQITRPEAVVGKTLTIDKSELRLKPGKRTQESELSVHIRSSKGSQHTLLLPEQAILQTVMIDGVTQPIRQKANAVTLPIKPGAQQISLQWHENKEQRSWLVTPKIDLGINSVNNHIHVTLGRDRWVLFTFGPKFGPAALIWGVLIVLALLSLGLGKIRLTPVKHWQWFLLLMGLSQIPVAAALVVVIWLMALGLREKYPSANAGNFNGVQMVLALLSVTALTLLFYAVQQGLLGSPDMQIAGNQSSAFDLNWYQDRNNAVLPTATVIAAPMMVYRILMLLWSLWLAVSLLNWLKWGWRCFSTDGLWKKREIEKKEG